MFETMILGAGPGGTGALLWAAREGRLGEWLDRGVAIVDQRSSMGGTLGRYALNADTLAGTFLECLQGDACEPWLAALRHDPAALALAAQPTRLPPLPEVGHFLDRVGRELAAEFARHPRSRFFSQARVRRLRLARDGSVIAELALAEGRTLSLRAMSAVLALGGTQHALGNGVEVMPGLPLRRWWQKLLPSDVLLSPGGAALARRRLAAAGQRPRTVILGGAHSAFSAAWMLLENLPDLPNGPGSVTLLHRSPPRLFYPCRADAAADGYAFTEADICPMTGRVHRLAGLRGDGRQLARRLLGLAPDAPEQRLSQQALAAIDRAALAHLLDAADLIIPALGYRLTTVPVLDAEGRPVPLATSLPIVDADARLLTACGTPLPNLFGVGLGSGFVPWGGMAGEPSFRGQQNSLWLYQNGLGALIHDGVRRWAAQWHARPGSRTRPLLSSRESAALPLRRAHPPRPAAPAPAAIGTGKALM